jgi:hypothetical protein
MIETDYYLFFNKSHVFVGLKQGTIFTIISPAFNGVEVNVYSYSADLIDALIKWRSVNNLLLLSVKKPDYKRSIFKLPTCVEAIKYLCGIRCGGITPYQFMSKLLKSKSDKFSVRFVR